MADTIGPSSSGGPLLGKEEEGGQRPSVISASSPGGRRGQTLASPEGRDSWNEFIARYASGEVHHYDFPTFPRLGSVQAETGSSEGTLPVLSPGLTDITQGAGARDGPSNALRAAAASPAHQHSGPITAVGAPLRDRSHRQGAEGGTGTSPKSPMTRPTLKQRTSSDRLHSQQHPVLQQAQDPSSQQTPPTSRDVTDSYQDQSAGPSNQDPDIPDIGASELPPQKEHRRSLFTKAEEGKEAAQQELTLLHVTQLNRDQKEAAAIAREERQRDRDEEREERRKQREARRKRTGKESEEGHSMQEEREARDSEEGSGSQRSRHSNGNVRSTGSRGHRQGSRDQYEHEDLGDPGPSSSAQRRFRRTPQDVELAPQAQVRISADSSPSDNGSDGGAAHRSRPRSSRRSGRSGNHSRDEAKKDGGQPGDMIVDDNEQERSQAAPRSNNSGLKRPRAPRSRGSFRDRSSQNHERQPIESVLESATGSSSPSHQDMTYDYAGEQDRIREFFETNGYLPAPRQSPDAVRQRLRVIRRLGLEKPDKQHRTVLDRFTRLAVSIFKTKRALVSIVGRDKQVFLSQIGFGTAKGTTFEDAFCCHTILGGSNSCMVVPDAAKDWRFAKNPLVQEGQGLIQFYAGAPLRVGKGAKAAVIGSMCVIDDEPKGSDAFGEEEKRLLQDLAECAVSERYEDESREQEGGNKREVDGKKEDENYNDHEAKQEMHTLELLYNQKASVEFAKLHQVSVDFLRRSLKHRPKERAGQQSSQSHPGSTRGGPGHPTGPNGDGGSSNSASSGNKRRSGADARQDASQLDIFDEACAEIRYALKADAVAIVDLSQFHLFYPSYSTSSTAGSTKTGTMTEATLRKRNNARNGSVARTEVPLHVRRMAGTSSSATDEAARQGGVDMGAVSTLQGTGSTSTLEPSDPATISGRSVQAKSSGIGGRSFASSGNHVQSSNVTIRDEPDGYQRSHNGRAARSTYMVRDSLMPSMTPQVLYIPTTMHKGGANRMAGGAGKRTGGGDSGPEQLGVLGYSSDMDAFAFNFSVTPASRKIIQDFIANHVKDRSVWYSRDDSEGIAQSITHLMPPGTETSLAMPVFGFDGQVSFAVVACWTDPLYSYPTGALQFVETIAGSLLASVMKEKLHQAERAQLNFAAAASHELRTPLHQINAAAALLRQTLQSTLADSPTTSPGLVARTDSATSAAASDMPSTDMSSTDASSAQEVPIREPKPVHGTLPITLAAQPKANRAKTPHRALGAEDRADAMSQLEMIEANGLALSQILENIIDTLDIGRVSSMIEEGAAGSGAFGGLPGAAAANAAGGVDMGMPGATANPDLVGSMMAGRTAGTAAGRPAAKGPKEGDEDRVDLSRLLEEVVKQTIELENKSRRIAGKESLDKVEIILEVAPRVRGQWMMASDPGPLIRALGKVIHNACKFTDKGYIHISMQDTSQDVVLPSGYDNSVKLSKVTIDIKDTGCGMTPDFLDQKILQPFAKADPFMPGSGLGLSLALRMINLLGGTLGIDSTHNKGTIVRVNIPLHLYSTDNELDQEEVANSQARSDEQDRARRPVRQDGVHLYGWQGASSGTRRVGKAILRQLKWAFCRTVEDPRYASLIVVPGEMSNAEIAQLARKARPGVELMILNSADRRKVHQNHQRRPLNQLRSSTDGSVPHTDSSTSLHSYASAQSEDLGHLLPDLSDSQVIRLSRPLYPSIIRRITRPPATAPAVVETYKSAVVGGQQATDERMAAAADEEAYAAQRRSDNEQEDYRSGARREVTAGGRDDPGDDSDTKFRHHRSNTVTSTSVSLSGDLSVSEAAAIRSLSLSEDLSGAEAAALREHGLSRYMSRPSVALSQAAASAGRESYDGSHARALAQGQYEPNRSGNTSPAPPRDRGQVERQGSIGHVDGPVEMVVGADWSSSDESQNDERSSSLSDEERANGSGVSGNGTGKQASEQADAGRYGLLSPPLAQPDEDVGSQVDPHLSIAPARPLMEEHVSDPSPLSPTAISDADGASPPDADRPSLKTAVSVPAAAEEPKAGGRVLKVLVVEDNPVNRKIMVTMLKRAACHYAEAVDGNDAVHQFNLFSPDVVLLDINMPGKDGFQAATEMRRLELERGVKTRARIVAVTALSSEGDKRRGLIECGIDEWKVKPVSMAQLRDDVKAMQVM